MTLPIFGIFDEGNWAVAPKPVTNQSCDYILSCHTACSASDERDPGIGDDHLPRSWKPPDRQSKQRDFNFESKPNLWHHSLLNKTIVTISKLLEKKQKNPLSSSQKETHKILIRMRLESWRHIIWLFAIKLPSNSVECTLVQRFAHEHCFESTFDILVTLVLLSFNIRPLNETAPIPFGWGLPVNNVIYCVGVVVVDDITFQNEFSFSLGHLFGARYKSHFINIAR